MRSRSFPRKRHVLAPDLLLQQDPPRGTNHPSRLPGAVAITPFPPPHSYSQSPISR